MGSGDRRRSWSDGLPSSERVYRKLREMILSGELPPGTRLVEIHLAEQFEVSRTPVREALKRLAAEQLVLADPVRGLIVHAPEPHEIEDVYRVRDALDALAVRLAAVRITPEEVKHLRLVLNSMAEAIEAQRTDLVVNANIAFHDVIYRAAGSATLWRLARELSDFVRRFSSGAFSSPERSSAVLDEHEAILDALERHDQEAAAAASSQHLHTASAYLVELQLRKAVHSGAADPGEPVQGASAGGRP
jgi:DNA-binding GntR family transcriptional regulator